MIINEDVIYETYKELKKMQQIKAKTDKIEESLQDKLEEIGFYNRSAAAILDEQMGDVEIIPIMDYKTNEFQLRLKISFDYEPVYSMFNSLHVIHLIYDENTTNLEVDDIINKIINDCQLKANKEFKRQMDLLDKNDNDTGEIMTIKSIISKIKAYKSNK